MNGSSYSRNGFPRPSELTDAARLSLLAIGTSLMIIALGWKSRKIPFWRKVIPGDEVEEWNPETGRMEWVRYDQIEDRMFAPLWLFKILTVLFHEMSHAIVGMVTGGKVSYISVNTNEGGFTDFKRPPARQPAYRPTLAAGYLCTIGCILLGCGFDALASKYAALGLLGFFLIALLICQRIRAKYAVWHYREYILYYYYHILRGRPVKSETQEAFASKARKMRKLGKKEEKRQKETARLREGKDGGSGEKTGREEEEMDELYQEKMVSLDLICLIAVATSLLILPCWLIADSIALRFLMVFIGLFSAVYAVQDIYDDGVKGHQCGSDAKEYAALMLPHPPRRGERKKSDPAWVKDKREYVARLGRKTKQLAWISLGVQLGVILATIVAALYFVQTTTAEQALQARSFLPAPWQLNSANILAKAQAGQEGLQEGWEWGKGVIAS